MWGNLGGKFYWSCRLYFVKKIVDSVKSALSLSSEKKKKEEKKKRWSSKKKEKRKREKKEREKVVNEGAWVNFL